MNGYICLWRGKRIEVLAESSYAAQQRAVSVFQPTAGRKKVKGSDVVVCLTVIDARPVGEEICTL